MLRCTHCGDNTSEAYVCATIARQGTLLGVLHVRIPESQRADWESLARTALGVADQLSLILSNLKLRVSLQQQALRDVLTGLFNRRFLDESLPRELARTKRTQGILAVALIDIDLFKQFNDKFGHSAGDAVLVHVAAQMRDNVRASDIIGRFGGEEFMLLMPDTERRGAEQRLETLREAVAALHIQHHGVALPAVTISIGVAFFHASDEGGVTIETLIEMADKALYQSKQNGRNRVTTYGSNVVGIDKHSRKD